MRRLILLISIPVLLASCNKASCWQCQVTTAGNLTYQEQFCDRTKKEIQDMEANPLETKDNSGQVIYSTTFSNCTRR